MMNLPFQFCTVHQTTVDVALIDSGATDNFIDENVWHTLNIGHFSLCKPITVNNMDGMENCQGKIEHYCWLKVFHQEKLVWM